MRKRRAAAQLIRSQRPEVQEARKKYNQEYRERPGQKERQSSRMKEWRKRPEVRERKREYDKHYAQTEKGKEIAARRRATERQKLRAMTIEERRAKRKPAKRTEKRREWERQYTKQKYREDEEYRAKVIARTSKQTLARRKSRKLSIAASQKWKCAICKGKLANDPGAIHIDHITPLALGGSNDRWNLQATHATCNRQKSDMRTNLL